MPRKLIRYIDRESFNKAKTYYQNISRKRKSSSPIHLNLEEYEAIRLYHYKHFSQSECAEKLNISQPTFSRIIRSALDKIAKALVEEKDFDILGGNVTYKEWVGWGCWDCDHEWKTEKEKPPKKCKNCGSKKVYQLKKLVSYFTETT